jgi:hypothetical protein
MNFFLIFNALSQSSQLIRIDNAMKIIFRGNPFRSGPMNKPLVAGHFAGHRVPGANFNGDGCRGAAKYIEIALSSVLIYFPLICPSQIFL